jgi:hypothetical protein
MVMRPDVVTRRNVIEEHKALRLYSMTACQLLAPMVWNSVARVSRSRSKFEMASSSRQLRHVCRHDAASPAGSRDRSGCVAGAGSVGQLRSPARIPSGAPVTATRAARDCGRPTRAPRFRRFPRSNFRARWWRWRRGKAALRHLRDSDNNLIEILNYV